MPTQQQLQVNGLFYQVAETDTSRLNITGLRVPNLTVTGRSTYSNIANLSIAGGTSGQVLSTNGSGVLSWSTVATSATGVTSVSGTGSGLGFSLGGTVTSSGSLTLTTPSATSLRTSLGIANVSDLSLNGSTTQYLRGDGTWTTISTGANVPNLNGSTTQFLRGDGTWTAISSSSGTVTSVTGAGSGLGFSLGGTVTSSGSITLSTPTADSLRSSLNLGTIANLNPTGLTTQYLRGDGTWQTLPSATTVGNIAVLNLASSSATSVFLRGDGQWTPVSSTGGGTVTSVSGTGSGLGFSLSGTVSGSGSLTLTTPTTTALKTSLGIGNISALNLNGDGTKVLLGNGAWGTVSGGGSTVAVAGSNTQVQFNDVGVLGASAGFTFDKTSNTLSVGNVTTTNTVTDTLKALKFTTEKVNVGSVAASYNIDALSSSILLVQSSATTPPTINIRGNASTTLSSLMLDGETTTVTVILRMDSTAYAPSTFSVDGVVKTVNWSGGFSPSYFATASSYIVCSLNIIKVNSTTTIVLGSAGAYK
jgi:hypothetical protein